MHRPLIVFALSLCFVSTPLSAQEVGGLYVKLGGGWTHSSRTTLRDRACAVDPLLNLFGCGGGEDGLRLGARGDFGSGGVLEGAVGVRLKPGVRVEAEVTNRRGLAFEGNANFLRAGAVQPVTADVSATSVLGRVVLDIVVDPIGDFVPFIAVGLGASRNTAGVVLFEFPGLAQPATTTVSGGSGWARAWEAGLGASLELGDETTLEVELRHSDLGRVRTDDGQITVVRGTRVIPVDNVAGLTSRLRTTGILIGVRRGL